MQEFFQPILDAARDAAIKEMPTVMSALAGVIVAAILAVPAIVKRAVAQAKLQVAAAAGVKLVEAKAQPAIHLPQDPALRAELKKEMADGLTAALLEGSSKKLIAKVGDAVQKAWQADADRKRESLANSERPTPPETPSAKREASR